MMISRKHNISHAKGKVDIGCLFLIILVVASVFVGFKFGVPYFRYYTFNREVGGIVVAEAAKPRHTALEVSQAILEKAQKLAVPITLEDIIVFMDEWNMTVDITWSVPVTFPGYIHVLTFKISDERRLMR